MARVTDGGRLHANPDVDYLINILAGDEPDLQQTARWIADHREGVTAQFLAELISASMAHGAMTMMSDIAAERHAKSRGQRARALQLWHDEYKHKENMSKGNAAPRIAADVGLAVTTVRKLLQGV
jgi:hydroxymethylglutaryl-CoA reductase